MRSTLRPLDGAGLIAFNDREYYVHGDACEWSATTPSDAVTTADAPISLELTTGWHCSHLYYRFNRATLAQLWSAVTMASVSRA